MASSDQPDHPGLLRGADRLPAAAGQTARDRSRLRISEAAVASEVIEFQLARQRVGLTPIDTIPQLSAREAEVVALLAAGRTDGEIAAHLYISKKTASVHVANIKGKLGAGSRVEIALLAAHLGLVERPADAASAGAASWPGSRSAPTCPFKGLASFDIADAPFFFGRERIVAELVARLAGSTFLAVVGPSGSGKSSVVRAGLVAALADGVLPGSERWPIAIARPGDTPNRALLHAVALALRDREPGRAPAQDLADALDRLAPLGRMVVVVDQFEELFTVCQSPAERDRFVRDIVDLAHDPGFRALVVIAIRADFYGRCASYRDLAELLGSNHVLVGPMTSEELTRAVDLPARTAGLRVEAGLTPELVAAVVDEPGALPLLSTTLLDLWQRRSGRTLRLEAYRQLGGVSGAVGRLAEAAYGRLTEPQQQIARAILLRLTVPGTGDAVVRRPVPLADLDEDNPDVALVLEVLIDGRLVTVNEGSIEVAHEALLREWPRLRRWLDEDAEGRRVWQHLTHAAREWQQRGESAAELYRGPRLAVALEWAADHEPELNQHERHFLDDSRAAQAQEVDRQKRSNRRLRLLLAGIVALLLVAVGAAWFAMIQLGRAEQGEARASRAAEVARSGELAASAISVLGEDPSLGKLLAIAAASIDDPPLEAVSVLHSAISADAIEDRHVWADGSFVGSPWADLHPSGTRFVASGSFEEPSDHLEVIDLAADEVTWSYRPDDAGVLVGPSFHTTDGTGIVVGTIWPGPDAAPARIRVGAFVLDADTGAEKGWLDLGPCGGAVSAISGTHLIARFVTQHEGQPTVCAPMVDDDHDVTIGLVEIGTGRLEVLTRAGALGGEVLSGDGRRVSFDDRSGDRATLVVADVQSGTRILELDAADLNVWPRALNEDGSLLLAGDRPMVVFEIESANPSEPKARFGGHAGESYFGAFVAGEDVVASTGRDGTLRFWDATTATPISTYSAVGSGRPSMSADGRRVLISNIESDAVALVDRERSEGLVIASCPGRVAASSLEIAAGVAAFQELCLADREGLGVVRIVDLEAGRIRRSIVGSEGQILRFSPDGSRIVYQPGPFPKVGPLVVVDTSTGRRLVELDGICSWDWKKLQVMPRVETGTCEAFPSTPFPIWSLAMRWSPDGSMIFAADNHGMDGYWAVWDATTGNLVHTGPHDEATQAFDAIFTPDSSELLVARYGSGIIDRFSTESWDLIASTEVPRDVAGRDRLWFGGYTSDGSILAVGGYLGGGGGSGSLHWLDPTTLQPRRPSVNDAHDGSPKSVALSPDGALIVTGASGDPVRVWDATTGELVHEVPLGDTQVQGVAFIDARHLAVTPERGNLLILTLDPAELLAIARESLTRGLTSTECRRFGFGDDCPTLEELRRPS